MRVREVLADVAHVDLPGLAGVIVIVDPGGDEALPGYLEMRIHENGAVRMDVLGTGNTRSFRSLGERSTGSDSWVECAPGG